MPSNLVKSIAREQMKENAKARKEEFVFYLYNQNKSFVLNILYDPQKVL